MIVRGGALRVESRLGPLHVDRQLDATQVELIASAIERVGWEPRYVTEVELSEGGTVVRRVRYNASGVPIIERAVLA